MLIAALAVSLSTTVYICSVLVVLILECKAFSIVKHFRWCLFKETLTFKCVLRLSIRLRTVLELGKFPLIDA